VDIVTEQENALPQNAEPDEALKAWIKERTDTAVQELIDRGLIESVVVETRPAWVFPYTLLIGKVRESARDGGFDWFICGDAPITVASSRVAVTPRDAARHFALQWQLEAARRGEAGTELAKRAEALYELTEEDRLWHAYE